MNPELHGAARIFEQENGEVLMRGFTTRLEIASPQEYRDAMIGRYKYAVSLYADMLGVYHSNLPEEISERFGIPTVSELNSVMDWMHKPSAQSGGMNMETVHFHQNVRKQIQVATLGPTVHTLLDLPVPPDPGADSLLLYPGELTTYSVNISRFTQTMGDLQEELPFLVSHYMVARVRWKSTPRGLPTVRMLGYTLRMPGVDPEYYEYRGRKLFVDVKVRVPMAMIHAMTEIGLTLHPPVTIPESIIRRYADAKIRASEKDGISSGKSQV